MPQKQNIKHKRAQAARTARSGIRKLVRPALVATVAAVLIAVFFALHPYAFARTPQLPSPPLKDLAAAHSVELGMLTPPGQLSRKAFRDVLTSQYSLVTTDGELHWDEFRPAADEYAYKDMDRIVDFAGRHGLPVQGHHLVWGEPDSLPKWLKEGGYDRQQLRDILRTHIHAVAGRYKGRVTAWTVVNEPFSRAEHKYGLTDWIADSLGGGTDYIDDAFVWARQADPDAVLILNDFQNDTPTSIADAQYEYVKSAKARGIPIDAVGMQMHVDAAHPPDKDDIIRTMRRFAELGTPVYVTEFDIRSGTVKGDAIAVAQAEARTAAIAVRACIESKNCVSFTQFGLTDVAGIAEFHAYNRERSYPMTSRYEPKLMFYGFRDAWLY